MKLRFNIGLKTCLQIFSNLYEINDYSIATTKILDILGAYLWKFLDHENLTLTNSSTLTGHTKYYISKTKKIG